MRLVVSYCHPKVFEVIVEYRVCLKSLQTVCVFVLSVGILSKWVSTNNHANQSRVEFASMKINLKRHRAMIATPYTDTVCSHKNRSEIVCEGHKRHQIVTWTWYLEYWFRAWSLFLPASLLHLPLSTISTCVIHLHGSCQWCQRTTECPSNSTSH